MIDPRKHNYYLKPMKLFEEGKVPRDGISKVDVCHDDWCRISVQGTTDKEGLIGPPAGRPHDCGELSRYWLLPSHRGHLCPEIRN